jgi:hypothetical protein
MNLILIAEFLRTLGLVAPLLGVSGATRITDAAALLIETGEAAVGKLRALTAEMKARAEAGITTTPEEILAVIDRIEDLDGRIQAGGVQSGRVRPAFLGALLGAVIAVALLAPAFSAAPAPRQAALSWTAPTLYTDGSAIQSPITYNVYRGARGSALAVKTRIATGLTALSLTDSNRPAGVEECYQVTAVVTVESDPTAEGCKSYPALIPAAPAGLTVQ